MDDIPNELWVAFELKPDFTVGEASSPLDTSATFATERVSVAVTSPTAASPRR